MTHVEQMKIYEERIEECKTKLLALSGPNGHPKTHVLDSFLSQVINSQRFSWSQAAYLRSIEEIADQLEGHKVNFELYQQGRGPVTTKAIIEALGVAIEIIQGYSNLGYTWKRSGEEMRRVYSALMQGKELDLVDWVMLHRLKRFDNIIAAYAMGELFHAGQLVQLRASVNENNILHGKCITWSARVEFYRNRREKVATVIAYDQKSVHNPVVTNKNGTCRVVTILPIGSVCPVYIMERDLKKVPSKVIAGGA